MDLRPRLLNLADRTLAVLLAVVLAGTTLAFGGETWWAAPAIAVLTAAIVLASLVRVVLTGRMPVLKSPLMVLGLLALGLAAVQLAPLPGPVAGRISPRSREVYALGALARPALAADPTIALPEPAGIRSPVTVDRSATLRWLAGAAACLALFWGVSQFADRLGRLYVVWGSIVAAFVLNTAIAVVQLVGGSGGLYGFIEPGKGPSWAPIGARPADDPERDGLADDRRGGRRAPGVGVAAARPPVPDRYPDGGPGRVPGARLDRAAAVAGAAPATDGAPGEPRGVLGPPGRLGTGGAGRPAGGDGRDRGGGGRTSGRAGPGRAVRDRLDGGGAARVLAVGPALVGPGADRPGAGRAGRGGGAGGLLARMPGASGLPVAAGGLDAAARVWADARAIIARLPRRSAPAWAASPRSTPRTRRPTRRRRRR